MSVVAPRRKSLTFADLQLFHEALAYVRKRSYQQADAVRIQGLIDRVEEILLETQGPVRQLRLSPPEQEVLSREIPVFCEALTGRGSSPEGAREAARLERILEALGGAARRPRSRWWRKFFRR
jgi:hypothetical protein